VDEDIIIALGFFVTVISLGVPLVRALGRRWERQGLPAPPTADTTDRLERIEQAVDAIAVEVERIAEGQRFMAKMMVEAPPSDHRALPGEERSAHASRKESA
jgi:hypothetical protein